MGNSNNVQADNVHGNLNEMQRKCIAFYEDDKRLSANGAQIVERDASMVFQGSSYTGKQTIVRNINNYEGSDFLKEDEYYFEGVNEAGTKLSMKRLTDGTDTQLMTGVNQVAVTDFNGRKQFVCRLSSMQTKYAQDRQKSVTIVKTDEITFEPFN